MTSSETWRGGDETWFVEYEGRVVGPVTGQQMVGAIQGGKLGPTARVRRPSSEEWVGIVTIPAFAAALGIAPPAADPFAGFPASVSVPPSAVATAAPPPAPPPMAAPSAPGKPRIPPAALAAIGCVGLVLVGLGCVVAGSLMGAVGDTVESVGSSVAATVNPGAPLLPQAVDATAPPSFFGTYTSSLGRYYEVRISAEDIRCNHSNHSNEWHQHRYGIAYASPEEMLLVADGGTLRVNRDAVSGTVSFDASGICPWGVSGDYSFAPGPTSGTPWVLLDEALTENRTTSTATLNETITMPRGTITLREVRRSVWRSDDETTDVVEMRLDVSNTSSGVLDLYLPNRLSERIATSEWMNVECGPDGTSSRGQGNPNNTNHRQPVLDHGVYSIWGGYTDLSVAPNGRASGWVTFLMTSRPESPCTIRFDGLGLGGGTVEWSHSFEN